MISLRKNHDAAVKSNTQGGLETSMHICYCRCIKADGHIWLLVQGVCRPA